MTPVSLALLGSVNAAELLLITAAALALVGFRVPAVVVRWARRAERR